MRKALFTSVLAAFGLVAMAAHAETEFDVAVSGNTVTVTTKGGWHVNKEYPWKFTPDADPNAKVAKDKFNFGENTATLANAPKGAGKLKGGVCSGDKCVSFEKAVTVN